MFGTNYISDQRCQFSVWAPERKSMILHIVFPAERTLEMNRDEDGYFSITTDHIAPGTKYFFMPDGTEDYPDPSSHHQPEGVHGPSAVVNHNAFQWQDTHWHGLPFRELVIYELHTGTFTPEGTFEAVIQRLDHLAETGINAIELMPVAQFPGSRNWGYDGVFPYAVQNSYGGPEGLRKLVNACHQKGIAVFLDVVYNHIGPEGNYFEKYGPYFTDKYATPWGDAINLDGEYSDGVREYFINNVLYWFEMFHIDGLRLDAVHMMFDAGAVNFWELLHDKVRLLEQKLGRSLYLIAESDLNSPRVVKSPEAGGYGFTAQWLDDFHHALYVLLDRNGKERYVDFGLTEQLAKSYTDGFVHSGEYVKFRKRRHGASSACVSGEKFVAFNQNHDQVGNRVKGERLSVLVDFERLKLAAAALILSPYVPMLFMGEEYAEDTPFHYFVSHSDEKLIAAVREGRKQEFAAFKSEGEPPDAQAESTFNASTLQWNKQTSGKYAVMLRWYRELLHLRAANSSLKNYRKDSVRVYVHGQSGFLLYRQSECGKEHLVALFNLSEQAITFSMLLPGLNWKKVADSRESRWLEYPLATDTGSPQFLHTDDNLTLCPTSVCVYLAV